VIPTAPITAAQSLPIVRGSSSIDSTGLEAGNCSASASTSRTKSTGGMPFGLPPPNAIRVTRALRGRRSATRPISRWSASR